MKAVRNLTAASVVVLTIAVGGFIAQGGEDGGGRGRTIKAGDLPAKVVAALESQFPGASILGAKREIEDGVPLFEVRASTKDGRSVEAAITEAGDLVEVEEAATMDSLPPAVAKTLKAVLPGGKLEECERKVVTLYSIEKNLEGRTYEVVIDSLGRVQSLEVEHEDGEDGEEDD